MNKALGLIETIGLISAIEAADAAVKAANVFLVGYENTRGGGMITIKLAGDVGAVQAAVSAGVAAAKRVGQVYSHLVIPRPHAEIDKLIRQVDRGQKTLPRESREESLPDAPDGSAALIYEPAPAAAPQDEAFVEEFAEKPEESLEHLRCIAITKAGAQCKVPALSGSVYCVFHQKQEQSG
jgi:ethanolamine utilization protein EutM